MLEDVFKQPGFAGFRIGFYRNVGDGDFFAAGGNDCFHGVAEVGNNVEVHGGFARISSEAAGRIR